LECKCSIFRDRSEKWDTVDFQGCNIGDGGCEKLSLYCANSNATIKTLNLSSNCLTPISVSFLTNALQCCVVNTLILSQNEISDDDFYNSLSIYYSSDNVLKNFVHDAPLLIILGSIYKDNPYDKCCVYVQRSSLDLQTLRNILISDDFHLYNVCLIDEITNKIYAILLYNLRSNLTLKFCSLPPDISEELNHMIVAFKAKKVISSIDFSFCMLTDTSCHALCNKLFNMDGALRYVRQLNLSGNELTISCLTSVIKSLRYCVIQQLIISYNSITNKECTNFILEEYCSKSNIYNFIEIPFIIINDVKTGHSATVLLKNMCVHHNLYDVLSTNLQGYHITDYTLYVTDSNIMIDDLEVTLPILCNALPKNGIVYVYETNLSDLVCEKIAKVFSLNWTIEIRFILSSATNLFAYKFYQKIIFKRLITNRSITTLQAKGCRLNPDDFCILFGQNLNHWQCIDLSECYIGDEKFEDLVKTFSSQFHMIFIKTLDLSLNDLTSSSVGSFLKLLCYCVIEHLIISDNHVDDCIFNEALRNKHCDCSINILNFVHAVPLVVTGTVSNEDMAVCNAYIIAKDNPKSSCYINIENNVDFYYIYNVTDNDYQRMLFSLRNINFTIEVIGKVPDISLPIVLSNIKFIFKSDSHNTVDFTRCSYEGKIRSQLFKTIFNKHNIQWHFHTLHLGSYHLPLKSIPGIVDCLQYCCVDYIIVSENYTLQGLADLVLERCAIGKRFLNSILRKPLTLMSHTETAEYTYVDHAITYFICYRSENFEETADTLLNQDKLQSCKLVFFNCLTKYQNSVHLLVNHLLVVTKKFRIANIILYEIGTQDELAVALIESLSPILEMVDFHYKVYGFKS